MQAKALEIRDRMTFIAALAVSMVPANEQQRYLLRRCGYAPAGDGEPMVIVTRLDGNANFAFSDPYHFRDRTFQTAALYIQEHWSEINDGDVIDVEFILGEKPEKKLSESVTVPI